MDIKFECPSCKQPLEATLNMAGQLIHCPNCQHPIEIPQPKLTWKQSLKVKTTDALKWCGIKIAETWQSGRKGKIICIETTIIFILAVSLMLERGRVRCYASRLVDASPNETDFPVKTASGRDETSRQIAPASSTTALSEEKRNPYIEKVNEQNGIKLEQIPKEEEEEVSRKLAEWEQTLTEKEPLTQERTKQSSSQCVSSIQASDLSTLPFNAVFMDMFEVVCPSDEGMVFAFTSLGSNIRILQSTSSGILVGTATGSSPFWGDFEENMGASRVVWIETGATRYEEGRALKSGFYVRCGLYSYTDTDDAEHTVARYVAVTDQKTISMLEAEQKRRIKEEDEKKEAEKTAEAARKEAEEAAEAASEVYDAIELDIPIQSLCGFKLGASPGQIRGLIKQDNGLPVKMIGPISCSDYRMATPFLVFTNVNISFSSDRGPDKHLTGVRFSAEFVRDQFTDESIVTEFNKISELLQKKINPSFHIRR